MRNSEHYFCGWYFRCQSENRTIALIPAVHIADGKRSGAIQIISDSGCWNAALPDGSVSAKASRAVLGGSIFREDKLLLSLHDGALDAEGELVILQADMTLTTALLEKTPVSSEPRKTAP